ncbi:AraC family transcriptional regulator [Dyella flagellata]|uniref:Transcriptional regulator n=1 Tax=Dyella flagellata TaxID=1867833 RepID=A0ABQ5XD11_9GAMM|nr:helix-turn-helix transcriptional regulator [Dyella flagellata]GLQ89362.1 transcriptional regulator [Dyella flagellata]
MRNTRVVSYEDTPRDVVATGNDYPGGLVLPSHHHKRAQCLYAVTGVLTVMTSEGSWVVPPYRALWIPGGVSHAVHMGGLTSTRSAYVLPEVATQAGLPTRCTVISVSPLLHALLSEAVDLPAEYTLDSRDDYLMRLLVQEIARMPALPLNTPLPQDSRLAQLCRSLLASPSLDADIDSMARKADMSRRNFTRLFREQTGMSFSAWRQQACLMAALVRLGRGQSVTHVAMELGYSSTSAFTAAFRRTLGAAPSHYLIAGDAS